jgi:hypothetical protein
MSKWLVPYGSNWRFTDSSGVIYDCYATAYSGDHRCYRIVHESDGSVEWCSSTELMEHWERLPNTERTRKL